MTPQRLAKKVAHHSNHPQAFEIVEALLTDQPLPEIKTVPRQYRVYEYLIIGGKATSTVNNNYEEFNVKNEYFIRWLSDWITIDADQQTWPSDLVSRIAKIDISAAQWLKDNWHTAVPESCKETNRLDGLLSWSRTPQGHGYWSNINRKLGE